MITIQKCQPKHEQAAQELIVRVLGEEFPKESEAYPTDDLKSILETYGKLGEAFFVAVDGGKVVGTIGIKRDDDRVALLRRLFVAPEYRRKRVGIQLLDRAIEFCREVGYGEVVIKTTSTMNRAVALCERKGFVSRARLPVGPVELLKFVLTLKDGAVLARR